MSDQEWLGWLELAKTWAAILVVVCLAAGIIADRVAKPVAKRVADARDLELAQLRTAASEAEQQTERERTERNKLEARIAPRRLDGEQQKAIAATLSWFVGETVRVRSYGLDAEAAILGGQILAALETAKLATEDNRMAESGTGALATGVRVFGANAALVDALVEGLTKIGGLSVGRQEPPAPAGGAAAKGKPVGATIFIGVKPIGR